METVQTRPHHVAPSAEPVARFLAEQYGGFADRYLSDIRNRRTHVLLSTVSTLDERVVGATQVQLLPGDRGGPPAAHLRLLAVDEPFRGSLLPLMLLHAFGNRIEQFGVRDVLFDADDAKDRFAAGYARRAGAPCIGDRHQLAIDAAEMAGM